MLAGVWGGRGEVVYSLSCPLLVQSLEEAMCSLTMAVVSVPCFFHSEDPGAKLFNVP